MKLLLSCSCLLAIPLQAVYASTFSNSTPASLRSRMSRPMAKSVVGELVKGKKPQGSRVKANVVVNEGRPKLLIELLLRELVEIVIDYFKDDAYSILVSTHNWTLQDKPEIAVDSARLYVVTKSEGIKGLSHSLANLKKDEHHCVVFDNPRWSVYTNFNTSQDGRYASFSHEYSVASYRGEKTEVGTKWFIHGNEREGGKPKLVAFGGEDTPWGLLSRDGQRLCSYNRTLVVTCIYQITEETGKDPTASLKFALKGIPFAVSGNTNRIIVANAEQLEVHDVSKDASELVCQINVWGRAHALNEDGSEAAYVNGDELQIVEVDKFESVIVTVKVPKELGRIDRLVYSDGSKLHVLHKGGKVSLFDPSTRTLICIEAPEEGQQVLDLAISPDADYYATVELVGKEEIGEKSTFRTIVKRKPTKDDWKNLFGYETDKSKTAMP